ncbi:hypothetical protein Vadar_029855 [Vaccinium darrowii]|uniref:Uncharacterized protein n=1 Tax=Vaccinium darrowii TaxID=229202 RepID=A0ACB7XD54_9ERIC|nr:hypothetical protein Vadar_029855 [Vaccinium darrowii]
MKTPPAASFLSLAISPLLFLISRATSAHTPETFLQCRLLHFPNSISISKVIYIPQTSSYESVSQSSIQTKGLLAPAGTPKPLVVITPLLESHIHRAINCSKQHGLQIWVSEWLTRPPVKQLD